VNGQWFAGRLRELREAAGLTQLQLAERAGVERGAVARWEAGTREPGWSNVLALARALGVECGAFDQEPAPRPEPKLGRPAKPAPVAASAPARRAPGRPRKQR
jgi:transcriptional regulator with XRE-family HTH domain